MIETLARRWRSYQQTRADLKATRTAAGVKRAQADTMKRLWG